MSLTNPNTPVSQQDLKDLYEQKILPYIGGAFGLVATGIDSANLYSTTERVVGQWIDGKPLYQKSFYIATISLTKGQFYYIPNTTINNIDLLVSLEGTAKDTYDNLIPLPFVNTAAIDQCVTLEYLHTGQMAMRCHNDGYLNFTNVCITAQYTKTTDSAVESYGTDTTYSTDEHVVGSWIDGKPVYQKTLTGTAPASSTTQNIQIGANVESALVISGYCQHESFLTPVNIQIDSNEYFMAWIRDNSNPNAPNTVGIKVGSALYNGSYRIVIQYTKSS